MGKRDEDEDDVELGNILLLILMMFLLAPVNALIVGAVCSKIWKLTIEQSLGEGPSPAAWFGVYTLLQLLTFWKGTTDPKTERKLKANPIVASLITNAGYWGAMVITLFSTALAVRILGWS